MKKARTIYSVIFCILLFTEVIIGLFIDDRFVRPYVGDILVTILLCCLCRTVVPKGIRLLPVYVCIFAALVELAQYIQIVRILGLENNRLLSTVIGTSFSHIDLVCYAIGCLIFWIGEKTVLSLNSKQS